MKHESNVLFPRSDALQKTLNGEPYAAICDFYAGKKAARSGLPYMNHIDEGLLVLDARGVDARTMDAYCLHPLVQADADLVANLRELESAASCLDGVEARVMEYRSVANEYLSRRIITTIYQIRLSPISDVNEMLIADKVQNYKDFVQHHLGVHPRSDALELYFHNWLKRLGVDVVEVVRLHNLIDDAKSVKEKRQHG